MLTAHLARRCPTIRFVPLRATRMQRLQAEGQLNFASNLAHRPVTTTEAIDQSSVWLAARDTFGDRAGLRDHRSGSGGHQ